MPIGPVYWGSYAGETLEKVMAVLVAQDHPDVRRRFPSSGDGGVDLYRQVAGGYHVTQVKGFAGRLSPARRRQIKESFDRLTTNPRLDRQVVEAVFTAPIDLTDSEQHWFDELVADAPFPCSWEGEVAWNSLAAKNPHVTDYFFADGRERVSRAKGSIEGAFSAATGGHISATEVSGHLELMRQRLNREDPHFSYDFVASSLPLTTADAVMDGAVMARTTAREDGTYVTVIVRSKHRYALEDAPIGGQLQITVSDPEHGIDIRDDFEAFRQFGRKLTVPNGALSVQMNAPGSLGGDLTMAGGIIGPRTPTQLDPMFERLRMRAVHPEDGSVAELPLKTTSITTGEAGVEIEAEDESGCFKVRLQVRVFDREESGSGTANFNLGDIEGKAISDVMPALHLVSKLAPPHDVEIAPQYGTRVLISGSSAELPELLTEGDVQYFKDLQTIQDHAPQRVVVPARLSAEEAFELHQTASMLRGEIVVDTWTDMTLNLAPDADRRHVEDVITSSEGALVIIGQALLTLDGHEYDVPKSTRIIHSVRLADEQPEGAVAITPGADHRTTFRLGEPPFEEDADSEARPDL